MIQRTGTRRRITLIDDHAEFRALMRELLSRDYEITTFSGTEISPDDIVDSAPDLLIVDLHLDRRDLQGRDIVDLVRSHERLGSTPIILCSADIVGLKVQERAVLDGGNIALLNKPFSMETVEEIVSHGLTTGFQRQDTAAAG